MRRMKKLALASGASMVAFLATPLMVLAQSVATGGATTGGALQDAGSTGPFILLITLGLVLIFVGSLKLFGSFIGRSK